jgi:Rrf2 family cysteine metabolism transcriptional repressor
MKISNKSEYAVRALAYLAKNYNNGVLQLNNIAENEDIPFKFLEQILYTLKSAGYVESKRGIKGGYTLSKRPEEITVGDIVRTIEGPIAPYYCTEGRLPNCPSETSCKIKDLWCELKESIDKVLDGKTLADLIENGSSYKGSFI